MFAAVQQQLCRHTPKSTHIIMCHLGKKSVYLHLISCKSIIWLTDWTFINTLENSGGLSQKCAVYQPQNIAPTLLLSYLNRSRYRSEPEVVALVPCSNQLGNKPGQPEQQQIFLAAFQVRTRRQPPQVYVHSAHSLGTKQEELELCTHSKSHNHRNNWSKVEQLTWQGDCEGWP